MEENDPGEIAKGCALIRANFHMEPETLDDEKWALLFQQAVWIENFRLENMARILAKLFSPAE